MQFSYFKVNKVYSIGLYPTMLALHQICYSIAWQTFQQDHDKPFGSRAEKGHTAKPIRADKKFPLSTLFGKQKGKRREPNKPSVVLNQIKYSA